jgi:hypothetical protein
MSKKTARMKRDAHYRGVEYQAGDLAPREAVRGVELLASIFDPATPATDVAPCVTLDPEHPPPTKGNP